jgi:uncharacterized protein YggE
VDAPTLRIVDTGIASRAPDVAIVRLAFITIGPDAGAAFAKDRAAYADFVKKQHAMGLGSSAATEAQTLGFPHPAGFLVYRHFSLHLRAHGDAFRVVQGAAAAGASIASVQYGVIDDDGTYRDAVQDALVAADLRGHRSAAALSLALGERTSFEPTAYRQHASGPVLGVNVSRKSTPVVPEPPTTLQARAVVTVTYGLRR